MFREPFPRLVLLAALLLSARAASLWQESGHARSGPGAVRWRAAADAPAESRRSGRPLLYVFSAHWCRPCRLLERELFEEPGHAAWIETAFVPVRIEDGLDSDGLDRAARRRIRDELGVRAFPTLLILRDGDVRSRQVGYPGLDATLAFLREGAGAAH